MSNHHIETVFELGWSELENGALLSVAEESFDLMITTDQQLRYQQNLSARKLKIVVLMTTSWPRMQARVSKILEAIQTIDKVDYLEIDFP